MEIHHLLRVLNEEFKSKAELAKLDYKNKVEQKLVNGNAKDAWKGLHTMMGRNQQKQPLVSDNPSTFANALNKFYARFGTHDYSGQREKLCQSTDCDSVTLVVSDVKCLSRVNLNKARGPDGSRDRVLKVCADQFFTSPTLIISLLQVIHGVLSLPFVMAVFPVGLSF